MYEPPTTLSLHRLSRHSLQDRYESDEEAVSESEAGAHDLLSSPIGSHRAGIFDSDLSADDISDRDEHTILAPPTVKRTRPVSSATLKRNSTATFDEDTYVFDPEEQMVLELPDSPPELATSTFLQPPLCIWPKPPLSTSVRSRSVSPSSVFSLEEADIQVAKKITILEPHTRPTVVFINALGPRGKPSRSSSRSRPPHSRSRESSRHRPPPTRADSRLGLRSAETISKSPRPKQTTKQPTAAPSSTHTQTQTQTAEENKDTHPALSATINRVSEIPQVLYIPASPRTIPTQAYHPRAYAQAPAQSQSQAQGQAQGPTPRQRLTKRSTTTPFSPSPLPLILHRYYYSPPNQNPLTQPTHPIRNPKQQLQCNKHARHTLPTSNASHSQETLLVERAFADESAL
ncbi:uncharacterized protein N7515_000766 [Penicillium bovifimosum]|uniref:Uncharacterized protein n=1 Tax=Penicillium bovifimosum TaxID=126998 RepID=A0A9W9LBD1_9EURO|nr:uncharacterized protein N7515_000766 [Penicillium bovifimosum]KAJ5146202.1 hypothetical protein N7515_000766 [Penicillium bovifimosum]